MIQRAYDLWHELESEAGRQLFLRTGGLMIGKPESAVVAGARRSAEEHGLRHEILSADEVKRRFPALAPQEEMIANVSALEAIFASAKTGRAEAVEN